MTANIEFLRMDIIGHDCISKIFSYLAMNSWLSIRLSCKLFLKIHSTNFDYSFNNNFLFDWSLRNNRSDVLKLILADQRTTIFKSNRLKSFIKYGRYLESMQILTDDARLLEEDFKEIQRRTIRMDNINMFRYIKKNRYFPNSIEEITGLLHLAMEYDISFKIMIDILEQYKIKLTKHQNYSIGREICQKGFLWVLLRLEEIGYQIEPTHTFIEYAYRAKHIELTIFLLQKYKISNHSIRNIFIMACEEGDLETVKLAMQNEPFRVGDIYHAFHRAARFKHKHVMKLLKPWYDT